MSPYWWFMAVWYVAMWACSAWVVDHFADEMGWSGGWLTLAYILLSAVGVQAKWKWDQAVQAEESRARKKEGDDLAARVERLEYDTPEAAERRRAVAEAEAEQARRVAEAERHYKERYGE